MKRKAAFLALVILSLPPFLLFAPIYHYVREGYKPIHLKEPYAMIGYLSPERKPSLSMYSRRFSSPYVCSIGIEEETDINFGRLSLESADGTVIQEIEYDVLEETVLKSHRYRLLFDFATEEYVDYNLRLEVYDVGNPELLQGLIIPLQREYVNVKSSLWKNLLVGV